MFILNNEETRVMLCAVRGKREITCSEFQKKCQKKKMTAVKENAWVPIFIAVNQR